MAAVMCGCVECGVAWHVVWHGVWCGVVWWYCVCRLACCLPSNGVGRYLSTSVRTCGISTSHQNVQPDVSIKVAEVACYGVGRTLTGCADPCIGGSVHPISVHEMTKNEVDESSVLTYFTGMQVIKPNHLQHNVPCLLEAATLEKGVAVRRFCCRCSVCVYRGHWFSCLRGTTFCDRRLLD